MCVNQTKKCFLLGIINKELLQLANIIILDY